MRIAKPSKKVIDSFPKEISDFYLSHAKKSYEVINSSKIQKFIEEILRIEDIDEKKIIDVRIMIFPCVVDSDSTSGIFNHDIGQISIYPSFFHDNKKSIPKCLMNFDNPDLEVIITIKTFQTFVHEILHLKYKNEDDIEVLTDKYTAKLCKTMCYF